MSGTTPADITSKKKRAGGADGTRMAKRAKMSARGEQKADDADAEKAQVWRAESGNPGAAAAASVTHAATGDDVGKEESEKQPKSGGRTTVVRLRRVDGSVVVSCDVYIGRRLVRGGWDLPHSKWANPFTVKACGTAAEAVRRYATWLAQPSQSDLRASIPGELRGKRLGCWCKNRASDPCHGDVLADIANADLPGAAAGAVPPPFSNVTSHSRVPLIR